MATEWERECLKTYGRVLSGKQAHWCPEWDYLPIDETMPEFASCTCTFEEAEKP